MQLSRVEFVEQFAAVLDVNCFSKWPRGSWRTISAPIWMSGCFRDWINKNAGNIGASRQRFVAIISPLSRELHEATPKGERLDPKAVTGMIYDRLAAAGIEVHSKPPGEV